MKELSFYYYCGAVSVRALQHNVILSTKVIALIGKCREFLKLAVFRALALLMQ